MSFLVDTDIVSAHLRGSGAVTSRFLQYTGRLHLSVVSLAELKTWIFRRNTPVKYRQALESLLRDVRVLPLDEAIADRFGQIGAGLQDIGLSLATPDLLIAATAIEHGLTVVTHNTRDFARVPGLSVVDWLPP